MSTLADTRPGSRPDTRPGSAERRTDPVALLTALLAGLRSSWDRGRRVERVAYAIGFVLIVSGLLHLAVYAFDDRGWQGPLSWRKAITFGLSFGMTLVSIAWATSFIRLGDRVRAWLLGLFTYACAIEVVSITLQAWRHEASHFNEESTFNAVLGKAGIAFGAGILVLTVVALTALNLTRAAMAAVPPSMRLALRAGWVTFLAAMMFGAAMVYTGVSKTSAPGEDAVQQQAAYTSAGWLKPAHAITMHAILVLPALAWLLSYLPWAESRRYLVVAWATGGYALLAAGVAGATLVRAMPLWATALAVVGAGMFAGAGLRTVVALGRGPIVPR